jgi:cellulose synthase operon protein C
MTMTGLRYLAGFGVVWAAISGADGLTFSGMDARAAELPAALVAAPSSRSVGPLVIAQAGSPAPAARTNGPVPVDESALRYFARQGDTRRLEIEIARLRALYPDWTPPADPLAVPSSVDERLEEIWMLYSQGRLAEARQAIARRQMQEPDWQPPTDLLERLAVSEARERLVNASNLDQYQTVISIGSETPSLLTCSEVDVLWRVAEAFAMTERAPRARDTYRYILTNCENPQERLATMQNAARLLPDELRDELLALERFDEGGAGEFGPVRDDIARQALADAGADATVVLGREILARVERLAETQAQASDARLLGWYYLAREDAAEAERWFQRAFESEEEGDAAEGLALALIAQDRFAQAEATIYDYRAGSDDRLQVYLAAATNLLAVEPRITLSEGVLARMVSEIAAARHAPGAQQLGWYARAFGQHETAGRWFETALSFDPEDEASAYGLALSRNQLGDEAGLAEIKRLWAGRSQRIAAVGTPQAEANPAAPASTPMTSPSPSPASAAAPAPTSAPTPSAAPPAIRTQMSPVPQASRTTAAPTVTSQRGGCTTTLNPRTLSPSAALSRGWCLMAINRPLEAADAFDVALLGGGQTARDAAYGQSLAYLRAGLVDQAAVAAASAPMVGARQSELQASILAERALASFEQRRFVETLMFLDQRAQLAAERNDLMVLRGYAYFNLNRVADAERVFRAVAATGSREGVRGLAAVREGRQPQ